MNCPLEPRSLGFLDAGCSPVEADAAWATPIQGLTLTGSYNYNNARYIDFIGPCYTGERTTEGCVLVGPGNAPFQSLSGKPLLNAPLHTASFGATFKSNLNNTLYLSVYGGARYSSEYSVSAFGQPEARQLAYTNIDASVQIGTTDDRWQIALIGKNLTNRFVVAGSLDSPETGSGTGTPTGVHADTVGYASPPRTVQLRFTFRD